MFRIRNTSFVRLRPPRSSGDAGLEAEFARLVMDRGMTPLSSRRSPTHLMPPTATVSAVMEALQRNDWPNEDEGVRVARRFTMPKDTASPSSSTESSLRRSWMAKEAWLGHEEFASELHEAPYASLLFCDEWRIARPIVFHGRRGNRNRAVQVIEVRQGMEPQGQRYTFCLQRVEDGPLRDCWLLVGVRLGDYASD